MRLENKVAIVTGAAQGLGEAVVKRFVEEGARVVATDINEEKLKKAMSAYGDKVMPVGQDVSKEEDWKNVVAVSVKKFGKLNIIVNNAAIMSMKNVLDVGADQFVNVFKVNCLSVMLSAKYAAAEMEKAGGGSIVNIDSIGGLTSGDADGGDAAYSASKGATRALTKHIAFQLAPKGIRCNTIHPGGIMTEMLKTVYNATPALWDRAAEMSPLAPHTSDPSDIANGVLYLASDEARTVTGTELVIDCGYMTK
ncbi:MAG: glucose 1-dehydrogenase [Corallococcus sp.]|nr:glucose 1-dehydrogenase [Corallococcus sp.]